MDKKSLEALKLVDIGEVDKNEVLDINDIIITQENTKEERIKTYLEVTNNPYFVRCGDILVKMSFSDNNISLEKLIERYLIDCLNERL